LLIALLGFQRRTLIPGLITEPSSKVSDSASQFFKICFVLGMGGKKDALFLS
jgi:hypothetical protein